MSAFDLAAEAHIQPDGTYTLTINVSGLSVGQANAISAGIRAPLRNLCLEVVTESGRIPHILMTDVDGAMQ